MMQDKENWHFKEFPNVVVLTTKSVVYERKEILYVFHDLDDGMWQFHSHLYPTENEAVVVGLKEIYDIDNTITEVADLPLGYYAHRKSKGGKWIIEKNLEQLV